MNLTSLKALYTRFGPFIRFCVVGISGTFINEVVLGLFTSVLHVNYLLSPVFATLISSTWNFALTELWVFRAESKQSSWLWRVVPFFLLNFAALAVREPIYAGLTAGLHVNYLISNLVSLGLLTVARYLVARGWIWRPGGSRSQPVQTPVRLD